MQNLNPPTTHDSQQDKRELKEQTEQARRVLMRLQWLMIILLASGIVWLYASFQAVTKQVEQKLTKIDTVDTRLNDIDDRLFALTPIDNKPKTTKVSNNDNELIKVELALVNRLYQQGNYDDALVALQAISYQLTQVQGVAAPIKSALSTSLKEDIAYLNALKNQPDAWQAHSIKMRDIQVFLRSMQTTSTATTPLNRSDILLHDATMMLSLAISSANIRDHGLMVNYLQEVRAQLEGYIALHGGNVDLESLKAQSQKSMDKESENTTQPKLNRVEDALLWVHELLANTPKDKPLTSVEMFK